MNDEISYYFSYAHFINLCSEQLLYPAGVFAIIGKILACSEINEKKNMRKNREDVNWLDGNICYFGLDVRMVNDDKNGK